VGAYVLDTDVLVAAFRSDAGASRRILQAALARRFEVLLSVPLMFEYEAVLCRPEHLAASGASTEDVRDVLDGLAAVGRHVKLAFRWRPALPDPNDDMVLETAINGQAHAIVLLMSGISTQLPPSSVVWSCAPESFFGCWHLKAGNTRS